MNPDKIANPDYRYMLRRVVNAATVPSNRRTVCWVMLNPSTADDVTDDPTIRKCIHLSRTHDFSDLVVVNLFAARSTKPKHLVEMGAKARGPENADTIDYAFRNADAIVFAWGAWWKTNVSDRRNGPDLPRLNVERLAAMARKPILCCGRTKDGQPKHPCYLPNDTKLEPY